MINIDYGEDDATSAKAIDAYLESTQTYRDWLGLSAIGHKCSRYLWYQSHGFQNQTEPREARLLRTFAFGNVIEDLLAQWLIGAGFDLSCRQWKVKFTRGDQVLQGSIDGKICGLLEAPSTTHLWEAKSVNSKGFAKFLKNGYEEYSPQYKTQIHCYAFGIGLSRIFACVMNKDTSELYTERIKVNIEYAKSQLNRAFDIIELKHPPDGTCPKADFYEAKWCNYREF
ncbi:MAG: hypothetical protein WA151_19200, partial [Desulfatirhabdiaceae bacterium]